MKKSLIETAIGNLILIIFLCFSVEGQHQLPKEKSDDIQPLSFGQSIEREISPMQKHRYQIRLEANQFIKIEVAEKLCDVVISLRSPDNVNILEYKPANSVNGIKTIQAAVIEAGNYELRIISFGEIDGTGNYSVKVAEIRPATGMELNFTSGVKLSNESFNATNPALSTVEALRTSILKGNLALEKFRLANAVKQEAFTLRQLSTVNFKLGATSQSAELSLTAIEKYRSISDKQGEAYTLMGLGDIYTVLGETEKAVQIFSESLKISRENKIETVEADVLRKLGDLYADFKDYDRAAIYYKQSADIIMQFSNLSLSIPLNNLGKIARYKNENESALEYFQKALETVRREEHRFGTTKSSEANYLNNIGRTQYELGRRDKAIEALTESLSISRQIVNKDAQAATLRFLGKIHFESGEIEKSLEFFNQSLEIYRATEDAQNIAETLLFLAKAEMKKGSADAAQSKTEEALKLIEAVRRGVQTAELRDSFSAGLQDFYEFYVGILMRKYEKDKNETHSALALQANERARARGLLNLLTESNANIREGMDATLLQKETELKNLLSVRLENLTKVLSGKSKAEDAEKLKIEIEQIRSEYEQIQAKIRISSPRYSALTQPKTLDLKAIQTEVLDDDSVLLEYSLGEEKSYLWIVSKNDFQTIELPAKAVIEKSARQFYESLTARNKEIKFETSAERNDRIFIADSDAGKYSRELSAKILAPAAPFLKNKRLLIVADGALQYIPFAALQVQNSKFKVQSWENQKKYSNGQRTADGGQFLIETNEIINLPSASVLAVLRNETSNRKLAAKTLAVLADPIFDKEDERFQKIAGKNKPKTDFVAVSKKLTRSGEFSATRDGLDLPRLPFTRREADLISANVAENKREKLLDFAANKTSAMSAGLSDFQYVHFATHGFINNENPGLSGIVFSMIDETGKDTDGFLRVGDIYNLKIPAEMVVLSGCRTGLGKEIKGEGLIGLTRGFMYAGAKRVTVSLWDVNDEATSVLMARFYKEMLGEKKLSPAAALQQAQISLIKNNQWSNPYFWSTFVLQGEPR
jgi:CHAT domain-containing protein